MLVESYTHCEIQIAEQDEVACMNATLGVSMGAQVLLVKRMCWLRMLQPNPLRQCDPAQYAVLPV